MHDVIEVITNGTLGTTTAADFRPSTNIAFLAMPASNQTNFAINADVTVVFGTEIFDEGNDFASNTFTAPITAKYHFDVHLNLLHVDSAAYSYAIVFITSNRTYNYEYDADKELSADTNVADQGVSMAFSILADMDATDTAIIKINQTAGTQQTDVDMYSWFSGHMVA